MNRNETTPKKTFVFFFKGCYEISIIAFKGSTKKMVDAYTKLGHFY
jgi:hypothetical protein